MTISPAFSIVLSTWNRGRHIVPTIRSVLHQTFTDYELLIVGDCCDDDTEAAVRPFLSERVLWRNLPQWHGNQYGPNNAGIEMARGRYIAYLGHDDLWAPDHLAALEQAFRSDPAASFVMSGCICYGNPGSGEHSIIAMFDEGELKVDQFYPPSSFAHRREAVERAGPWRSPETICATTDADFLLRAEAEGMKFARTGRITVHKFHSGVRYLLYVRQRSEEQEILWRLMGRSGFDQFLEEVTASARAQGMHLGIKLPDFSKSAPGRIHDWLGTTRGVTLPPLVELAGAAVMPQDDGHRLRDWGPLMTHGKRRFRRSARNPRPRMLIPFFARDPVMLHFVVHNSSEPELPHRLRLVVNEEPVPHRVRFADNTDRRGVAECSVVLPSHRHSVVTFDLTGGTPLEELFRCVAGRPERIALGEVWLRPSKPQPPRFALLDRLRRLWPATTPR